ncbi:MULTISPECIES: type II toxin-antitoxin system VapB family antitoxin [unclassified Ornithinimicrobium]|uniref:type II toxin-antitoxin system VapB family antitoxin n=1 Tax=unclassified Ornithinimicrobium TaxID=2615080 RepID=UPI0038524E0D
MALNIDDAETERLARQLAGATGETITVATRRALDERLRRVMACEGVADTAAHLRDVITRGRARTNLDDRSGDEILGYDSEGLPTS